MKQAEAATDERGGEGDVGNAIRLVKQLKATETALAKAQGVLLTQHENLVIMLEDDHVIRMYDCGRVEGAW